MCSDIAAGNAGDHRALRKLLKGIGSICAITLAIAVTAPLVAPAETTGSNGALAAWLPDANSGFDAWSKGRAATTTQYDYFVCAGGHTPTVGKSDLSYAGSSCPALKRGTAFAYEPTGKGSVVYDRARKIVLYGKGCCAERGFALVANFAQPPKPVGDADLHMVRTMRGVALGMTRAQVARIYGPSQSYGVKGRSGVTALSYTTMKTKPNEPGGACGQFQTFSFRQDRLISIELLAAC